MSVGLRELGSAHVWSHPEKTAGARSNRPPTTDARLQGSTPPPSLGGVVSQTRAPCRSWQISQCRDSSRSRTHGHFALCHACTLCWTVEVSHCTELPVHFSASAPSTTANTGIPRLPCARTERRPLFQTALTAKSGQM